jgi:hypothetical protein
VKLSTWNLEVSGFFFILERMAVSFTIPQVNPLLFSLSLYRSSLHSCKFIYSAFSSCFFCLLAPQTLGTEW